MNVQVTVTEADIQHGKRADCAACPVALAINRLLKPRYSSRLEQKTITIGLDRVHEGQQELITQQLGLYPVEVAAKIRHYDETGDMEPFSFGYDIVDRVLR